MKRSVFIFSTLVAVEQRSAFDQQCVQVMRAVFCINYNHE